ncbi:hypothetical protein H8B15_09915 [Hymenobacter sp. BT507]|uniref:Uncharacterized protein n=1 Tax=Hymenobacter citatus TaxID=2763506 RepID=A0ABR7MJH4_9BACT|nr:hypothetical protein [Hymenobacter citatus]MBC6611240.1 hypothetical protein [Hymenobacter citatus]
MQKKILLGAAMIVLMPAFYVSAQTKSGGYQADNRTQDAINAYSEHNNYYTFDNRYKGLKGSPFILPKWSKGDIEMSDSKIIKSIPVRIDAYNKAVLVKKGNGDSIALDDRRIKSVTLYDEQLKNGDYVVVNRVFKQIPAASELEMGSVYFEELFNSNGIALLKNNKKVLKKASGGSAYNSGNLYDEIIDKEEYFIYRNNKIMPVKLSEKSFEKAMPNLMEKIKHYSLQRDLRSEKDFIAMLTSISMNAN